MCKLTSIILHMPDNKSTITYTLKKINDSDFAVTLLIIHTI